MTLIFHLSIYTLTTLAALMLSVAEEIPFPTGLTVLLAPLAYVLNEQRGSWRLSVRVANWLGVAAILVAGVEAFVVASYEEAGVVTERRVLAGAHLLSYLTWISLFQRKEPRHYWWLLALGLMQVAVGSILSSTPTYGLLLFVYILLGLWTLSVFSLFQAEQTFVRVGRDDVRLAAPIELSAGSSLRLHLVHRQSDDFRNAIQLDPRERWINYRFIAGVTTTSVLALTVGMLFFISIPRLWVGRKPLVVEHDTMPLQTVTGFSEEVQLGQIGQILESNAKAFEVRFFHARSDQELDIRRVATDTGYMDGEPMFRGSVMGIYDNGRWRVLPESQHIAVLLGPSQIERQTLVRQHFTLADAGATTLFGMQPVTHAEKNRDGSDIGIDIATSIVMRGSGRQLGRQASYSIYSSGQRAFRPRVHHYRGDDDAIKIRQYILGTTLVALPTNGLPRLRKLAEEIRQQVRTEDGLVIAKRIESHLRDSGLYTYSLNAAITDPKIDPVEDFLFNRKQGHCEYYASAMALMLRSLGIPTRLVSGYKGGEVNKYSGAFVVEQRHAHAWVEAFVNGAWQTFDPTPASREDVVRQVGYQRSLFAELRETMTGLWSQQFVQLSFEQQSSQIYRPLGRRLAQLVRRILSPFGSAGSVVADFLVSPRRWFSVTTFVVTFGVLVVMTILRILWRRFGPQNGSLWQAVRRGLVLLRVWFQRRISGRRVEFYERFLTILGKHGLVRSRTQTPLEFAGLVQSQMASRLESQGIGQFPTQLVQLFYRVRFGEHEPAEQELAHIESSLSRFDAALSHANGKP